MAPRITTKYHIAEMDCSADEQVVRMAVGQVEGAHVVEVDLEARTVLVGHTEGATSVTEALSALGMSSSEIGRVDGPRTGHSDVTERRVLVIALVINATFFVGELFAGLLSRSMGLTADSLDMLADASVYGLSVLAVGTGVRRKKRLARWSGILQLTLASLGLVEVARRTLGAERLPDAGTMAVVASVALVANVATLLILRRAQSRDAHFQASWIFTANDIKVNALVIGSAGVVALTQAAAADLITGALIFLIVAGGARRILALSR